MAKNSRNTLLKQKLWRIQQFTRFRKVLPCFEPCRKMKKQKGFTLIELLVVIAIIALLMAILMPALQRVKRQTQAVICRSNVKQWGLVFNLYTNDNNDSFPQSIVGNTNLTQEEADFLGATLPYYENLDMRMCPVTKTIDRPGNVYNYGGVFKAWGPFPPSLNKEHWYDHLATGSYAINAWCADPPPGFNTFWGLPSANAVRKIYDKSAYQIPLVGDSAYYDTAVKQMDNPPTNAEHEKAYEYIYPLSTASWAQNAMKFYAMNRHNRGINMVFVDMHVQYVDIKQLWRLKWHQNFDTNLTHAWPTWLEPFPDY